MSEDGDEDEDEDELGERCAASVRRLHQLVLGYDISEDEALATPTAFLHRLLAGARLRHPAGARGEPPAQPLRRPACADAAARDPGDIEAELGPRAPGAPALLPALPGSKAEGLPETFVHQLRQALARYAVHDLERTPKLEEACHRIFLPAAGRSAARRARDPRTAAGGVAEIDAGDEELRELLDRLVAATERREPVVADLARAVRYRLFDEPVIEEARERVYAEMEEHLTALADDPARDDRYERVRASSSPAQPLAPLLTRRIGSATPALRNVLIQAMTGRYHRQHPLSDMHFAEVDGVDFLLAKQLEDRTRLLAVAFGDLGDLPGRKRPGLAHPDLRPGDELVADFYSEYTGPVPPRDGSGHDRRTARGGQPAADAEADGRRRGGARARPRDVRGRPLHLRARRRWDGRGPGAARAAPGDGRSPPPLAPQGFELERLASPEDVYLFRGTAHENPKDERLFALAEVRDMTPVYDSTESCSPSPSWSAFCRSRSRPCAPTWPTCRREAAAVEPCDAPRLAGHRAEPRGDQERVERHAPATNGLGIEMILLHGRVHEPGDDWRERLVRFFQPAGSRVLVEVDPPPVTPVQPLDEEPCA